MTISNKIHRGTATAAGVFLVIVAILGVISQVFSLISNSIHYDSSYIITTIVNLVINTASNILLAVMLFRGKKDSAAGVVFILTALPIAVRGILGGSSVLFTYLAMQGSMNEDVFTSMIVANAIRLVSNILSVLFRILLAMECFKPGNICGGKMKFLLVVLPILVILTSAASIMAQSLYVLTSYDIGQYLVVTLPVAVITAVTNLGLVLMGLALATPVYESAPRNNPYDNTYAFDTKSEYKYY